MAYCYDRGGGQYTSLVPVDRLPVELENIPRRVNTEQRLNHDEALCFARSEEETIKPRQVLELAQRSPLPEATLDSGLCLFSERPF